MVPNSTTERKTKPKKEAVRPQRRLGTGKGCLKTQKRSSKDTFYSLGKAWVVPAPSSTKPEERHFVIDSGASMHMLSKKDLWSGELETLKRSRSPITVVTAKGEVQTNEVQVYVHDLHTFVTVQLLEDTPAVFSLGKLCKEHDYTYEWPSDREPRLTNKWESDPEQN